jgi:hypothetical protein
VPANKGKKAQRQAQRQAQLPTPKQKGKRTLRDDIKEELEQRFVDWDELPEWEQQDILNVEQEKREAEQKRKEELEYLAKLDALNDQFASLDPSMASGSGSGLSQPPTLAELTMFCGQMGQLLQVLSNEVGRLTTEVANVVTNQTASQTNIQAAIQQMTAAITGMPVAPGAAGAAAAIAAAAGAAAPGGPARTMSKVKDVVSKPKHWDGKGGSVEARHFLAAFSNWAFHTDDALNNWDNTASIWHCDDGCWIQAVLNLMDGDAHTWALPKLEQLGTAAPPFGGIWTMFEQEFTRRFILQDINGEARDR